MNLYYSTKGGEIKQINKMTIEIMHAQDENRKLIYNIRM